MQRKHAKVRIPGGAGVDFPSGIDPFSPTSNPNLKDTCMNADDSDGEPRPGLATRARRVIVGGARDPHDPSIYHKVSLVGLP